MEAIQEFLKDSLKSVDLKTVTKAELKQMYLQKKGIAKLSKEDKKLFSTAVESAYIDFIKNESCNSEEILKDNDKEVNGCEDDSESADSDVTDDLSHDSGLGVSHKESLEAVKEIKYTERTQVTAPDDNETPLGVKSSAETSECDSFHGSPSKSEEKVHKTDSFPNGKNEDKDALLNSDDKVKGEFDEEVKRESDDEVKEESDDEVKEESDDEVKEESDEEVKEESDNEPLRPKTDVTKKSVSIDLSSDSDDEPLMQSNEKQQKKIKSNVTVSDSEDEPLISKRKYSKALTSDSENEPLVSVKKAGNKAIDLNSSESEDQLLINIKKHPGKNVFSEYEEEPLVSKRGKKSPSSLNKPQKQSKKLKKTKHKSVFGDSEEKSLSSKKAKQQKKSLGVDVESSAKKPKVPSKSADLKPKSLKKRVQKSFVDSSDSDELPLISIKAQSNPNNSVEKSSNRNVLNDSDDDMLISSVKGKQLPKRKSKISSDDSDDNPLINLKQKNNGSNISECGVSSSDSDKPLSSLKTKSQVLLSKSALKESDNETSKAENNKQSPVHNRKKENKSSHKDNDTSLTCGDSGEDILPETEKTNLSNPLSDSSVSDSDEEPLASFSKNISSLSSSTDISKKMSLTKKKSISDNEKRFSESNIPQKSTHKMDTSDSEEEPLSSYAKKNEKTVTKSKSSGKRKKFESSSDEGEAPIVKKSKTKSDVKKIIKKSATISSDSEDEPLASYPKKIPDQRNIENEEDSSMDENEEKPIVKSKGKGTTKVNKAKVHKKLSPSEAKLENLKKYIRAAGMHINSYDRLFENCKSMKSKCEKLTHLLEKEGLKGRPTLVKCKKLKKKIETKKEVAELDLSNIISSGRPKRTACSDTTNCIKGEDSDVPLAKYSRLKGIVDSEDSD